MNQPKIKRVLQLMMYLTGNVEYTIEELGRMLDMSTRTIYRYLDTFKEAGFLVTKSGRFPRIDKKSQHFREISQLVHFTEEEAAILRQTIEGIDETNILKQNLKKKLSSIYDRKFLTQTIVKGKNARNVNSIVEAIEEKQQICLHGYSSSQAVKDHIVEPIAFTTNYINLWAWDLKHKENRLFKVQRIEEVEILPNRWEYELEHREGFTDIFRMSSQRRIHIRLELGQLACNILREEYPLSDQFISEHNGKWILDTDVAELRGVGRFVTGLLDDIIILEGDELKEYIITFWKKNSPKLG